MHLRIWWHLCVLDSRVPEDHGFQPTVDLMNQHLRLPLNVNDNQIYPEMTKLPAESAGWTEMSFFLIQTESCRFIHPFLDAQQHHSSDVLLDINEKRKRIQDPGSYLSNKYGISAESETLSDLQRNAIQHVTTACKKMEFVLQLREEICLRRRNDAPPSMSKKSFDLACNALESSHVLKEGHVRRFKWFFNMYTQWYVLSYVFRCLCITPCGLEADRAWDLAEANFPRGSGRRNHPTMQEENGHGRIWRLLKLLRRRVWSLRQNAQRPTATTDDSARLLPSEMDFTSQLLSNGEIPLATDTTAGNHKAPALFELDHDFVTNATPSTFDSLSLFVPEIQSLPDWNAIING